MKVLRLAGLGVVIWGLSLLWPELTQLLTPSVMIGVILGLGALTLAYALVQHFDCRHDDGGSEQDHPSRPIPAVMTN